jgi:hypothetical protein
MKPHNGSRTMMHARGLGRLGGRCALHGAQDCPECDPESDDLDAEVSPEEEAELVRWLNEPEPEDDRSNEIALVLSGTNKGGV